MIYCHSSARMPEIEDNSVHLVVTSPPYPMVEKWDNLFGTLDFHYQHSQLNKTWIEVKRVLVEGGIACINIGDATRTIDGNFCCYPNYAMISTSMMSLGMTPLIPIIWKKISNRPNAFLGSGMLPPNGYIAQDCEYIGIYRKGRIRKFKPHDEVRYESSFTKEERDRWFQQIWEIPGAKGAKETSAFPLKIPFRLIQMFSCFGEVVLDPYSGTGTTQEAAAILERDFIGYEINGEANEVS